jgi:hypothetical protein
VASTWARGGREARRAAVASSRSRPALFAEPRTKVVGGLVHPGHVGRAAGRDVVVDEGVDVPS